MCRLEDFLAPNISCVAEVAPTAPVDTPEILGPAFAAPATTASSSPENNAEVAVYDEHSQTSNNVVTVPLERGMFDCAPLEHAASVVAPSPPLNEVSMLLLFLLILTFNRF